MSENILQKSCILFYMHIQFGTISKLLKQLCELSIKIEIFVLKNIIIISHILVRNFQ